MAEKTFHYNNGKHEVDVSIEYRMPTRAGIPWNRRHHQSSGRNLFPGQSFSIE
ncbi:MAG: hypothetical protein U5K84_06775 [Alkalibacterium sp.]|nr:hypothetical protein [Alkalibacterium sp.]